MKGAEGRRTDTEESKRISESGSGWTPAGFEHSTSACNRRLVHPEGQRDPTNDEHVRQSLSNPTTAISSGGSKGVPPKSPGVPSKSYASPRPEVDSAGPTSRFDAGRFLTSGVIRFCSTKHGS